MTRNDNTGTNPNTRPDMTQNYYWLFLYNIVIFTIKYKSDDFGRYSDFHTVYSILKAIKN